MKKILIISPLLIFSFIIVIFFYSLIIDRNPSEIPSVLIGKKTPKFIAYSLFDNTKFNSLNEIGKEITIVNFFASWCIPCKKEHHYIKKLNENNNIKIIGINYKDNTEDAIKWLSKLGNPYDKIIIDTDGLISIEWGVYGIPETFVVKKNNIIDYKITGPIQNKDFQKIQEIIKQKN